MGTTQQQAFDTTVNLRLHKKLKKRLKRIARRKYKRLPEVYREALLRFVEIEEQQEKHPA